jgi:hypothetical protein
LFTKGLFEYVFSTGDARKERESTGANGQTPPPKPLGSIYRGGGDGCLYFISLVGLYIISIYSNLYNKVLGS